ncbi:TetR/AcrR family transcriptional regulator [Streptomyces piniterrae]|uniref:TetR/AcrR family transcriptional regulator n=1 Tax=Streptomyces piniterrae TaxID=2571125 RepID=A0A4U0MRE3_9ACTN|nr:TetR/AcrR family transcriptional regulator [Streptomyces piniterrae]TJZ43465.1 TetR/AcrR family transcriptional regulator [Streptomyces piniterrae]
MARPPRFDTPLLLDVAVRLAAESGPSGVTMSAVAAYAGAPSGSLYHRFAGRSALLAEVWLRTVEGFQEGYFAALKSSEDPRAAGRAASRYVVAWSRAHPDEATLLLYGARDFGQDDWSAEHLRRAEEGNRRVLTSVRELAEAVGASDAQDVERVSLALIDIPLSLIRRHLRGGTPLPPHAEALVEQCTDALLDRPADSPGRKPRMS